MFLVALNIFFLLLNCVVVGGNLFLYSEEKKGKYLVYALLNAFAASLIIAVLIRDIPKL